MDQRPNIDPRGVSSGGEGTVQRSYFSPRTLWLGKTAIKKAQDFREFLHRDMNVPRISTTHERYVTDKADRQVQIDRLRQVISQSKEVIARVRTIFPLSMFPDDIILDRTKVTIIQRNFFWSSNVLSVRIEDILNVKCSIGPLFGAVTISIRVMNSVDHFEVGHLWRRDAMEIKRLIQGYMFAKHSNVNLDNMSVSEVVKTLEDIGEDSSNR